MVDQLELDALDGLNCLDVDYADALARTMDPLIAT